MGLLSLGTPYEWKDAAQYASHVRRNGIEQLINIYNAHKDKKTTQLLWGDEVEYMVVTMDDKEKRALLSLNQEKILDNLTKQEEDGLLKDDNVSFHPEYGRYMLEATPARPYTGDFDDILRVEGNMLARRRIAKSSMEPREYPVTLTSYPRLGAPGQFTKPFFEPKGAASRSLFLPDEIINTHVRFPTLTANIRRRRGEKVAINIPVFKDKNTADPFEDPTIPHERNLFPKEDSEAKTAALTDHIYMDSMGFGMGCSCLQITFQATDIHEARRLYDQLTPLTPILLALSAASPAYRGYLSDQDVRWNVISASVDDRRRSERGLEPLKDGEQFISKSRYDSIDRYIGEDLLEDKDRASHLNDTDIAINDELKGELENAGFDSLLADHFGHLFIRDPIVVFAERLEQDNQNDSDHFENIQSTNWQTMRFKPPPPNSSIGWRVEFRPMEIQITDFENAAFAIFVVLLTRVIISYNLSLLMPISLIDANMKRAHARNACGDAKFWFKKDLSDVESREYAEMSVNEVINGCGEFIGLVPLVRRYLHQMGLNVDTMCKIGRYLDLVSKRASGQLQTNASWIRDFIRNHADYKDDSVVSAEINYDLVATVEKLARGEEWNGVGKGTLGGFEYEKE